MKIVPNNTALQATQLARLALAIPQTHAVASQPKLNGSAVLLIALIHLLGFVGLSKHYQQTSDFLTEKAPMVVTLKQSVKKTASAVLNPEVSQSITANHRVPVTTHEKSTLLGNDAPDIAQSKSESVADKVELAAPTSPDNGKKSEQKTEATAVAEPPRFDADYLHNPSPEYPALSRRRGEQGRVMLKVSVNAKGEAEKVLLDSTSGFEWLDKAALEAVKNWKFIPAKNNHQSVNGTVMVPIRFSLEN